MPHHFSVGETVMPAQQDSSSISTHPMIIALSACRRTARAFIRPKKGYCWRGARFNNDDNYKDFYVQASHTRSPTSSLASSRIRSFSQKCRASVSACLVFFPLRGSKKRQRKSSGASSAASHGFVSCLDHFKLAISSDL